MTFQKGQGKIESGFSQGDVDNIWELFFGNKWSIHRIADSYGREDNQIIGIIDSESARRWRQKNKGKSNRLILGVQD